LDDVSTEVRIERLDPADEDGMRQAYDAYVAARLAEDPHDPVPTFPEVLAQDRAPEDNERTETWLRRVDGEPVGAYRVELPMRDNLDLAQVDLGVHPAHQHRGHGRALFEHALARVTELGRHQVIWGVNEPPDGSISRPMRFAEAAGGRRSLGEIRRALDLTTLDRDNLARLRQEAEAAAAGYTLVGWTGRCPDELIDGYAGLTARMSTDAPMGGLDIEPEVWDAARIREREEVLAAQGRTKHSTAAHAADGTMVAFTEAVTTVHDPDNAFQWDTLVRREDRGHRLGLLVKLANLDRLLAAAPEAKRIFTWNADVNAPMIAVNELMGFRVVRHEAAWRLDLPRTETEADVA
jgi:GNAT superfamily N-acetyltransferase